MLLSIVVCTYNRNKFICSCLDSILREVNGCADVELIVVDNASTDNTSDLVKRYSNEGVKYLYEGEQGLSHARNAGFQCSEGIWVAYIDDDALLRNGWLTSFRSTVRDFEFDCFGGPYFPWYKDGKESWFPDIYGSNMKWLDYHYTQPIKDEFSGGNAVFKKELLERSSGFPVDVGMKGGVQSYGEETYLIRWLRNNLEANVGFVPSLAIDHYVPIHKQQVKWFMSRAFAEGRDFALSQTDAKKRCRYLFMCLLQFLMFPLSVVKIYLKNYYSLSLMAVFVEAQRPVSKLIGFVRAVIRG